MATPAPLYPTHPVRVAPNAETPLPIKTAFLYVNIVYWQVLYAAHVQLRYVLCFALMSYANVLCIIVTDNLVFTWVDSLLEFEFWEGW